ncbi:hypothetical protein HDU97_006418 [Phlyctochytrium planicorne]|nr:hypothetical protein HDU97_006418 [Phlyctochytrium planicorne]
MLSSSVQVREGITDPSIIEKKDHSTYIVEYSMDAEPIALLRTFIVPHGPNQPSLQGSPSVFASEIPVSESESISVLVAAANDMILLVNATEGKDIIAFVYSAGADGEPVVTDWAKAQDNRLHDVAIAIDRQAAAFHLFISGSDGTFKQFKVPTAILSDPSVRVHQIRTHIPSFQGRAVASRPSTVLSLSATDEYVFAACEDGSIWQAQVHGEGKIIRRLIGHDNLESSPAEVPRMVWDLCCGTNSSGATTVYSASFDRTVREWVLKNEPDPAAKATNSLDTALSVDEEQARRVWTFGDGANAVAVLEINQSPPLTNEEEGVFGTQRRRWSSSYSAPHDSPFSPKRFLLVGLAKGTIIELDLSDSQTLDEPKIEDISKWLGHEEVHMKPSEGTSSLNTVHVGHTSYVTSIQILQDTQGGNQFVSGGEDGTVRLWNIGVTTGKVVHRQEVPANTIYSLAVSKSESKWTAFVPGSHGHVTEINL